MDIFIILKAVFGFCLGGAAVCYVLTGSTKGRVKKVFNLAMMVFAVIALILIFILFLSGRLFT